MQSVYCLVGDDEVPFYIGSTGRDIEHRLRSHIVASNHPCFYTSNVLVAIRLNKTVSVFLIEELDCSRKDITKVERYWVHQFKAWGFRLVNKCLIPRRKMTSDEMRVSTYG